MRQLTHKTVPSTLGKLTTFLKKTNDKKLFCLLEKSSPYHIFLGLIFKFKNFAVFNFSHQNEKTQRYLLTGAYFPIGTSSHQNVNMNLIFYKSKTETEKKNTVTSTQKIHPIQ